MLAGVLWPPGWGWPACDATTAGPSQQGEVGTHLSRALGDAILADDPGACVVQLQMATQAARQRVDAALTSVQSGAHRSKRMSARRRSRVQTAQDPDETDVEDSSDDE